MAINYQILYGAKPSEADNSQPLFLKYVSNKDKFGLGHLYNLLEKNIGQEKKDQYAHSSMLANHVVICKKCFNDKDVALISAKIGLGGKGASTNIQKHNKRNHANDIDTEDGSMSVGTSVICTVSAKRNIQGKLFSYSGFTKKPKLEETISRFQNSLYICVNDNAIPRSIVEKTKFC